MSKAPSTTKAARGSEAARIPAAQPEGTERTRELPVYAPRVDIIEIFSRGLRLPSITRT